MKSGHLANQDTFMKSEHCVSTLGGSTVCIYTGKWVRIINMHIRVATCLNETKKGGETSKSYM